MTEPAAAPLAHPAHHLAPPLVAADETCSLLGLRFHVSRAWWIVGHVPRVALDLSMQQLAPALTDRTTYPDVVRGPNAAALDARPLLLATLPPQLALIDGAHRLARAQAEGRSFLPCYILTAEETLACLYGPCRRPEVLAKALRALRETFPPSRWPIL